MGQARVYNGGRQLGFRTDAYAWGYMLARKKRWGLHHVQGLGDFRHGGGSQRGESQRS